MNRYDSFLSDEVGAGGGGPTPLPTLPSASDIQYWFAADYDCYSDSGATTPCVNNDGIYNWLNQGVASDHGVQATSGNRPIFKTGGLNGLPYVECVAATGHWFDDLLEGDQPSGISSFSPYTVFVVVDNVDATSFRPIFGSPAVNPTTIGKCSALFHNNGGNISFAMGKTDFRTTLPNRTGTLGGANVMAAKCRGSSNASRGTHAAAMTDYSVANNSTSSANTTMRFLRNGNTPSALFDGRLYEAIYYDIDLPNSDCDTVISYLQAKYGIT